MTDPYTMLTISVTFWVVLSIGGWWQGRSWFPFTLMAPIVLIGIGVLVNKFLLGWGNAGVTVLHVALWGVLLYVVVSDIVRRKGEQGT